MDFVTLNNGVKMPRLGFGVFQVPDGNVAEQAVYDAICSGYRLIDTAAAYQNEESVGKAISRAVSEGLVKREELFITTKLWVQDYGYENTKRAFEKSVKALGLEYLDLYLFHQPFGDYYSSYRAMVDLYKEGKIRAVGVSNMYPDRLCDLCENFEVLPAVNQVELHPFFQQEKALETMKNYGVVPEAWGPFAEGKHGIFTNPVLAEIAAKHGKTVGQVVLRWNIQRGVVVIPKSVHKNRMEENIAVWDFTLDGDDMKKIAALDIGHSEIVNHSDPAFVKMINTWKIHE